MRDEEGHDCAFRGPCLDTFRTRQERISINYAHARPLSSFCLWRRCRSWNRSAACSAAIRARMRTHAPRARGVIALAGRVGSGSSARARASLSAATTAWYSFAAWWAALRAFVTGERRFLRSSPAVELVPCCRQGCPPRWPVRRSEYRRPHRGQLCPAAAGERIELIGRLLCADACLAGFSAPRRLASSLVEAVEFGDELGNLLAAGLRSESALRFCWRSAVCVGAGLGDSGEVGRGSVLLVSESGRGSSWVCSAPAVAAAVAASAAASAQCREAVRSGWRVQRRPTG